MTFEEEKPSVFEESQDTTPVDQQADTGKPLTPEERMAMLRHKVVEDLYKNDPAIKEGINAQLAVERSRGVAPAKESPFEYDASGNLLGVKGKASPTELMQEIKKNTERKLGVSQ